MASKRFDLCIPKPSQDAGKPFWHKVGVAFLNDTGNLSIKLDSVPVGLVQDRQGQPAAWDGWLKAFEATGRGGGSTTGGGS